jgi:hypothetical protein
LHRKPDEEPERARRAGTQRQRMEGTGRRGREGSRIGRALHDVPDRVRAAQAGHSQRGSTDQRLIRRIQILLPRGTGSPL